MASHKFWFNLDKEVDRDIIKAIQRKAGKGRTSKVLVRIIYEWYNSASQHQSSNITRIVDTEPETDDGLITDLEDIFK